MYSGPQIVRVHSRNEQAGVDAVTDFDVVLTFLEETVKEHLFVASWARYTLNLNITSVSQL